MADQRPFWQTKTLEEMSRAEWESLCDGCAKCCMVKLEDEDTGEVHTTAVVCHLLNIKACKCSQYSVRQKLVPTCEVLDPDNVHEIDWMPDTCAYRLLAEGKDLFDWHPLVSGDPNTVHTSENSVRDKVISEADIAEEDVELHIIESENNSADG
jgi:uncharacterized cysteine cluster protein YcgN (CxxCxxCC family)